MKQLLNKHLLTGLAVAVIAFLAFFLWPSTPTSGPLKEGENTLKVDFHLPDAYRFIREAPHKLEWSTDNPKIVQFETPEAKNFTPFRSPYKIKLQTRSGNATIQLKSTLYYCAKDSGMCFQNTYQTSIPIQVAASGTSSLLYIWEIPVKNVQQGGSAQAVGYKR